jgi:hypothetical protein
MIANTITFTIMKMRLISLSKIKPVQFVKTLILNMLYLAAIEMKAS